MGEKSINFDKIQETVEESKAQNMEWNGDQASLINELELLKREICSGSEDDLGEFMSNSTEKEVFAAIV